MPSIEVSEKLISFLTFLPVFFISIAVHEYAHAFAAHKYGDNTAKDSGRLTLNPFKHLDIVGSVIMPLASFATGIALIGWAKPVPVNRNNFKNILRDDAVVSFAGPLSNFILAVILFGVFLIVFNSTVAGVYVINFLWYGVFLNIFLCLFNLLPIPPLDGSHILFDLFPNKITAGLLNLGLYGSIILLIFIYSPLWNYFFSVVNWVLNGFLSVGGIR
ncbi:MAG: site-2 protease family protein [Ignavibacteriales bacterium]|nr:MAG: site-2 protease family protein [Ignavibacteriales bacterium]